MSIIDEVREGAVKSRTVKHHEHFDLSREELEELILESLILPGNSSVSFAWCSFGSNKVSVEIVTELDIPLEKLP